MPPEEAAALFSSISGSDEWAREMVAMRPFAMVEDLVTAAERCWAALSPAEIVTALDRNSGQIANRLSGSGRAETNHAEVVFNLYRQRFGFIVLSDVPSETVGELAANFERRMSNSVESELASAAKEQFRSVRKKLLKVLEQ